MEMSQAQGVQLYLSLKSYYVKKQTAFQLQMNE